MKPLRLYFYRMITFFLPEMSCNRLKASILRWCGAEIGTGCRICSSAMISGSGKLSIGNETYIGPKVTIRAAENSIVRIGNYCDIAVNCCLWGATHSVEIFSTGKRAAGPGIGMNITIEDGVWLCAGVIVNAGVTVGYKTVIAAGGVVTRDIGAQVLAGGVPCKIIKDKE